MPIPKVRGVASMLKKLDKFGEDGRRMAVAITDSTAANIANKARVRVPTDLGALKQSIGYTKPTQQINRATIYANAPYAPFVEFGTRTRVRVPKGFEQLAAQFKGKKIGGLGFLESIKAWCKSKGIDPKAAWPIMIKLLRIGMNPQPFMIPSYQEEVIEYPKRLKKAFDKLTKDFNNSAKK